MTFAYAQGFEDIFGVHWSVILLAALAIYWLGSLVGWWRIPFMCKIKAGWEPIWTPFRRGTNWVLVPEDISTPRKLIFWDPSNFQGNNAVVEEFTRQIKSGRIMRHVVKSLPDHDLAREWWLQAARKATPLQLHPTPVLSCAGWAQVLDPVVFNAWDRCLLGLECCFMGRGKLTASICGHELVHLTQQVRNREMNREWGLLAEWETDPAHHTCPPWLSEKGHGWHWLWRLPFLHELALEAEAHWRFKLSPALASILIALLLIVIQYGKSLVQ